jgi:hypothetical protein
MAIIFIGRFPVYTDDNLKNQLNEEISKHNFPAKNKVLDMIDKEIIIPVTTFKSELLQKMLNLFWSTSDIDGIYRNGKIYIVYMRNKDDSLRISKVSRDQLNATFVITIHECVHYVGEKNKSKFYSINLDLLCDFYETFFKKYLLLKKINRDIVKQFVIELAKQDTGLHFSPIVNFKYNRINKIIGTASFTESSLEKEEYDKRINDLSSFRSKFIKLNLNYSDFPLPKNPLFSAYDKICKKTNHISISGQELWSPSEVICILSECNYTHPNITKTLSLL